MLFEILENIPDLSPDNTLWQSVQTVANTICTSILVGLGPVLTGVFVTDDL